MEIPENLLNGYRRFREEQYASHAERYRLLVGGQNPKTMVIGCADSRVDPAAIFSAGPGELFVLRNVAAVVPPCEELGQYHGTSAAIEFAVSVLGVENIVVLGHGLCGGVEAAFAAAEKQPVGRFIGPWVELLSPICAEVKQRMAPDGPEAQQREAEQMVVRQSLGALMSFSFVADAVGDGRLKLHGAWFTIAEGELLWHDAATDAFRPIPV